jgi:hypothetical protein
MPSVYLPYRLACPTFVFLLWLWFDYPCNAFWSPYLACLQSFIYLLFCFLFTLGIFWSPFRKVVWDFATGTDCTLPVWFSRPTQTARWSQAPFYGHMKLPIGSCFKCQLTHGVPRSLYPIVQFHVVYSNHNICNNPQKGIVHIFFNQESCLPVCFLLVASGKHSKVK